MNEQEVTAREDIKALAAVIHEHMWGPEYPFDEADCCAEAILSSDWLASHDEGVRAAERERLAAAWEEVDGPDRVRRPPFRPFYRTPTIDLDEE